MDPRGRCDPEMHGSPASTPWCSATRQTGGLNAQNKIIAHHEENCFVIVDCDSSKTQLKTKDDHDPPKNPERKPGPSTESLTCWNRETSS
jgi:hypothetical protein